MSFFPVLNLTTVDYLLIVSHWDLNFCVASARRDVGVVSWRDIGKVLQKYWRGAGGMLARS